MVYKTEEYQIIKDLQGYFTLEQINSIINATIRQRDRILLRILSRTGRRITEVIGRKSYIHRNSNLNIEKEYPEIIGIRPMDINWDEELIAFPILKKKRLVRKLKPLDKITLDMLRGYIAQKGIEPQQQIFHITRFRAFQIVKEAAAKAGIYMIGQDHVPHPHHFRHSFAINVLKHSTNPSDIKKIQMALEHSNLSITSGYLQFSQKELKSLIKNTFKDGDEDVKGKNT